MFLAQYKISGRMDPLEKFYKISFICITLWIYILSWNKFPLVKNILLTRILANTTYTRRGCTTHACISRTILKKDVTVQIIVYVFTVLNWMIQLISKKLIIGDISYFYQNITMYLLAWYKTHTSPYCIDNWSHMYLDFVGWNSGSIVPLQFLYIRHSIHRPTHPHKIAHNSCLSSACIHYDLW